MLAREALRAISVRGKPSISMIWSSSYRATLRSTSALMQEGCEVYECIHRLAPYSSVVRSELFLVLLIQSLVDNETNSTPTTLLS